ncbi:ZIP family metal transporter [Sulfuricurvum sp.]|uniref:ZIP family metal transporter n=1 Tax=Sulfuricurvum sp. TaxID=2025608 RepID=UPI003567C8E6
MSPWLAMLIPAVVASLGGVLAIFWNPSHHARSLIQHFAAGVVLAALAVEVLPELGREHAPAWVLISAFTIGGILMYIMKLWSIRLEEKTEHLGDNAFNYGLIAATFIDVAVDGFIIGAGFAAGGSTGLILALGLSVELLFLGLSLVSETIKGWRVVIMTLLLAGVVLSCTLLGNYLLAGASTSVISAILAFGVAALLYLVTDELLVEAHVIEEKPSSTLWLFAGFLVFWSIQLFSGE